MTERKSMRIGRGGKRGKTAGRGTKGQNARAGRKKRPELRDIIKKLPKRRGYGKNRARTVNPLRPKPFALSVSRLDTLEAGAVTVQLLVERGLVADRAGRLPRVKLVGTGVSKKFAVQGMAASASARAAIEKAGGTLA